jgi:hypothetical protein
VYRELAFILEGESDLQFAKVAVQALNLILLTSPETKDLCQLLRQSRNPNSDDTHTRTRTQTTHIPKQPRPTYPNPDPDKPHTGTTQTHIPEPRPTYSNLDPDLDPATQAHIHIPEPGFHNPDSTRSLLQVLYSSWCHCPMAAVSLCLLAQAYEHACTLITSLGRLGVGVGHLVQVGLF